MANPYDFVNAINAGKNIIRDDVNPEAKAKEYVPFLTHRAFSYYIDTVLVANEVNINNSLDNTMDFEFFLHAVRPRRRIPQKWAKHIKSDDVALIQEVYNCNYRRAEKILKVLTPEQITIIKNKQFKGGTT